ncbi:MAG: S-adenosylmethionine decarboxylase, partial [Moorellaceae bacterium]
FTCGEKVNPWDACRYLTDRFQAEEVHATEIQRGIIEPRRAAVVNL